MIPPTLASVAVLRCDSVAGSVVVVAASASEQDAGLVQLPVTLGDNCATGVADLLNSGWELKFVSAGSAVAPGEGASGFVTEYTFVSTQPQTVVAP